MENGMDMAEIDRRVEELLDRMTLEEMILQTDQYGRQARTEKKRSPWIWKSWTAC